MMAYLTPQDYLDYVKEGIVPPCAPSFSSDMLHPTYDEAYEVRQECSSRGMWPMVEREWVKQLANWIGDRTVLEVMAGAGWLAKALSEEGVAVLATDDYSWDGVRHDRISRVFPVVNMSALEAVRAYSHYDILLVSWPPHDNQEITEALEEWGHGRSVIYIGEISGGITGATSLFRVFREESTAPSINKVCWPGHYDKVHIGAVNIPEVADWLNLWFVIDVMAQIKDSYNYIGWYYRLERKIEAYLEIHYELHGVQVDVDYNYIVISYKTNTFYVYNTPEMRKWLLKYRKMQSEFNMGFCISPTRIVIENGVASVEKETI